MGGNIVFQTFSSIVICLYELLMMVIRLPRVRAVEVEEEVNAGAAFAGFFHFGDDFFLAFSRGHGSGGVCEAVVVVRECPGIFRELVVLEFAEFLVYACAVEDREIGAALLRVQVDPHERALGDHERDHDTYRERACVGTDLLEDEDIFCCTQDEA